MVKGKPEESKATPKAVEKNYSIYAWFHAKDEEGAKIKVERRSEASSLNEALELIDWPKGLNCPVQITVNDGNRDVEVRVSPTVGRLILEHKNIAQLRNRFGVS